MITFLFSVVIVLFIHAGQAAEAPLRLGIPIKNDLLGQPKAPEGVHWDKAPMVLLNAPDIMAALVEDKELGLDGEKDALRIGLFQELFPSATAETGGWQETPDGEQVWMLCLHSPGALGMRVAFDRFTVPAGGTVWLADAAAPGRLFGPVMPDPAGGWPLWSPACPGESVLVLCLMPKGVSRSGVDLEISRLAHIYRDPVRESADKASPGPCHLDVTCQPAWADFASAVGGLCTVTMKGLIFCTCTLLNENDPCEDIPYVLTANHCVGGQTGNRGASSVEFYWLFETAVCGGTPPGIMTVPRTVGGADYVAGMGGTGRAGGGPDVTLLRIRSVPPPQLARAGWTTTVPPLNTPVTGVHHPRGSHKRISHGALKNIGTPHPDWYHEVRWTGGTTEPASSGSPLAMTATGQIIGQLWGGDASCDTPGEPDYYGRFDKSYALLGQYLEAPAAFFMASGVTVDEGAGTFAVTVILSRAATVDTEAAFTTEAGTALPDRDYVHSTGTIPFPAGETQGILEIALKDNVELDGDRVFTVRLTPKEPCLGVSPNGAVVTVTVLDNDVDTDGDGLSDAAESGGHYGHFSDPGLFDSDGDGLSDYDEVMGTHGHVTDPMNWDTDGDGFSDFWEIMVLGRNPLDPNDTKRLPSLRVPWVDAVD